MQLDLLAETMEKTVDIDGLLKLAASAEELENSELMKQYEYRKADARMPQSGEKSPYAGLRIGVARDEAFCFFYEDNLDYLREQGAELIEFSPIHDKNLPRDLDGLILNGGYPELYARVLSQNHTMLSDIRMAVEYGLVTTAECGGFMYLHESMEDMDGQAWPMVGAVKGRVWKTPKLTRFGYVTLEGGEAFGREIGPVNAHEFHYFDSDSCGEDWHAQKPLSARGWNCIHAENTLFAGFPHIYYYANEEFPKAFLEKCLERKQKADW